jgi:hypothetical protein
MTNPEMELESCPCFISIDYMSICVDIPGDILDLVGEIHLTIISTLQVKRGEGTYPHWRVLRSQVSMTTI